MTTYALDLGCGDNPQNPFNASVLYGIDSTRASVIRPDVKEITMVDLSVDPIPYNDNFFDYVTAFDFIEHVPRLVYVERKPVPSFVNLMNEIYRVLKPGGLFYSLTPAYPSPKAFQDPTHVNIITEETFPRYFTGDFPWAQAYGYVGRFVLEGQVWVENTHLSCKMKKISAG